MLVRLSSLQVLAEVRDAVLDRIRSLSGEDGGASNEKNAELINGLLTRCFPLYKISHIRPVVLEVLKRTKSIPEK